ncbi:MAG: hypothetical protein ACXACX_20010 [Candidatus Hodarchaeales archaeon]|jgi:predicted transcriptional regulator with HTH domain
MSYHLSLLINNGLIETENRSGRTYNLLTEYGKKVVTWINGIPKDKEVTIVTGSKD